MRQFSMQCTAPDDIEFTLNVTPTLREWKKLGDQLRAAPGTAPGNSLVEAVRELTFDAAARFVCDNEEPTQS